jgi:hypothetical protein
MRTRRRLTFLRSLSAVFDVIAKFLEHAETLPRFAAHYFRHSEADAPNLPFGANRIWPVVRTEIAGRQSPKPRIAEVLTAMPCQKA